MLFVQEKRRLKFESTKREIVQIMSEIGIEANTEFEQDVVCEDADTFGMSSDRMMLLKTLLRDVCC